MSSIGFKSKKLTSMHKIQKRTCNPQSIVLFTRAESFGSLIVCEINLICLMYLDLSVTKRCSSWRHGFRKQALLSRWKYAKSRLDHPTGQGDFASCMGPPTSIGQISHSGRFQHQADFTVRADFSIGQIRSRENFSIKRISHSGRFQHQADFTVRVDFNIGQISQSRGFEHQANFTLRHISPSHGFHNQGRFQHRSDFTFRANFSIRQISHSGQTSTRFARRLLQFSRPVLSFSRSSPPHPQPPYQASAWSYRYVPG